MIRNWRPPSMRPPRWFEDYVAEAPLTAYRLWQGNYDIAHAFFPADAWAALSSRPSRRRGRWRRRARRGDPAGAPDPDEKHLLRGHASSMQSYGPNAWFPTCNLAMPRDPLERLSGSDEEFAFHCEDTDLGLRAEELGARLLYVDEALVWHAVHPRLLRVALRDATQRHAEAEVITRHPRHRDALYMGLFLSEEHARLAIAGLGLLVAAKHPRIATLATYPYVIRKLDRQLARYGRLSPSALVRLSLALLGSAVVDGVEVSMRMRASMQARVLVL